ncbi:MAG: hypothetical protein ACKOXP_03155, partial [Flavobacteriales bacterium]
EVLDDSTLVAINDSGNEPIIYVLNTGGQIKQKVRVNNAKNEDWEALASDDQFLYIGDIGNNLNERKALCIYRIRLNEIKQSNEVQAEKMDISYREQKDFPPADHERYFDAEAMTFFEGQLWIFTKNSTKPFDGKSYVYMVQFEANQTKSLSKVFELKLNQTSYLKDAVTSACTDGQSIVLSTYNRLLKLEFPKQGITKTTIYTYPHIQQMEACACLGNHTYILSNESNKFLGPAKLKIVKLP